MSALLPSQPHPPAIRRLCVAVDIESYSSRSIPQQIDIQTRLLWILAQACRVAGVKPARCDRQDSGDGQILVLPPGIDEAKVLPGLVLGILTAVRRANEAKSPAGRMRLRISLGQGAIQLGQMGFGSQAVITVSRLLDSAQLRADLAAEQAAEGAVVVTDDLYRDMFSQGYGGLEPSAFREVQIDIPAKQFTATAWIQVPVDPPLLLKVPTFPDLAAAARRRTRIRDAGAAAAATWAILATAEVFLDDVSEGAEADPPFDDGHHLSPGHDDDTDSPHSGHDSHVEVDYHSPHRSTLHPPDDITSNHDSTYNSTHDLSYEPGHEVGSQAFEDASHNALADDGGGHSGLTSGSTDYGHGYDVPAVDATYGYDADTYPPGDANQHGYDHDSGDHAHDAGLDLADPDGHSQN